MRRWPVVVAGLHEKGDIALFFEEKPSLQIVLFEADRLSHDYMQRDRGIVYRLGGGFDSLWEWMSRGLRRSKWIFSREVVERRRRAESYDLNI